MIERINNKGVVMNVKKWAMLLSVFLVILFGLSTITAKDLRTQDSQTPTTEEMEEGEKEILFYIYPSLKKDLKYYEQLRNELSKGFDNVDLSYTNWSMSPSALVGDEYSEIQGIPVSLENFKKTWNYQNKRLSHVFCSNEGGRHSWEASFDFKDWTLYHVDFICTPDLSMCNFEDALLLECTFRENYFRVTSSGSNNEQLVAALNEQKLKFSFKQFSSTWNYKHNQFENNRLSGFDFSGWNFENKDLSRLYIFINSSLYNGTASFKNASFSDYIGKETDEFSSSYLTWDKPTFDFTKDSPDVVDKEILYESQNYQSKDCRFLSLCLLDEVDLSEQDLEFSVLSGECEAKLRDSRIGNAQILNDVNVQNIKETRSYREHDLSGCSFRGDMTGFDFSAQNLTGFVFAGALKGADFTNAIITFCDFKETDGLTPEQLKGTWNYKTGNLKGIVTPWDEWNKKYSE